MSGWFVTTVIIVMVVFAIGGFILEYLGKDDEDEDDFWEE